MYYGRTKRHGSLYMRKLAAEFKPTKLALRKWLGEVDTKAATAEQDGGALTTWGEYAAKYLRETEYDIGLADKTKAYRRECVTRITKTWEALFKEDLRSRKVSSVPTEQCMQWSAHVAGWHHTTFNNTVSVLKAVFNEAIEAGYLLSNPARKVKRLGKSTRRMFGEPGEKLTPLELEMLELPEDRRWYLNRSQFRAIVKQMRSYKFGHVKAAADFAELLYFTGCRLSEANRLRWQDVDWRDNTIRVSGAKGRATSNGSNVRYVPISDGFAKFLRRQAKRPHKPEDKIATVKECRGTLQRACVALGFRKLDHHDLRHTFTSLVVANNIPIAMVADWLGHKDGGVLLMSTYRHEVKGVSQRWVKKLRL